MSTDDLRDLIDEKITTNGEQEITGAILNNVLQEAVDTLADGENLDEGSIKTANIADGAITTDKIADGNVKTDKIEDHAVTKDKLEQNVSSDLDWAVASNSYYRNSQAGDVAAKVITTDKNMSLIGGGSLKVTFEQANTADDATLNIDGKGAKPLYYNGKRVSSTNSWEANETVEIYYNNYNSGIYYAKRWMVEPVSVSQNTSRDNAKATAITIGGTNYNITDEDAQEKTSDLISKMGYESSEITLTEDNFDGIYYGANGVIQSDSAFDGFILYVESKHIKWLSQSGLQSMRVFDEYPTIGMTSPYSDIIDLHNFVGDNVKKFILVTIRKQYFTSFIYQVIANGLIGDVKNLDERVETLENKTALYIPLTPITENHGLIKTADSIFNDGDIRYPYTYRIFPVVAGQKYYITGYSVNTEYVCASAGKSSDGSVRQILLTGTTKSYTDEEITIPEGYDRLYVNQNITEEHTFPIAKENKPINEQVIKNIEDIETLSNMKTNGVTEIGSNLSQDEINSISGKERKIIHSNTSVPIVAFIYDDTYSADLVQKFDERGLKVSFAMIGNINKSAWASVGNALRAIQKNGHGTVAHGVVGGISVQGSGVDTMNDADVKKALEGENKAFDDYKLSHRGLVEFNTWHDRAHTWAIVGRYYDYLIGFDTPINTPSEKSLYELGRYNTDGANMLSYAMSYVDDAIKKGNCLLIFGGHYPQRTGSGASGYSTMADFEALLDYVKSKVDDGLLMSMNIDDAVDKVWSRNNGILKKNYTYENPSLGELRINNGIQYCSAQGRKAQYTITLSGTPINGSFDITLGDTTKTLDASEGQTLTINTESGQSISDVIDSILSKIYYAYSVRKTSNNELTLYRDIDGVTFTPIIDNNTSGVEFEITRVVEGEESVWE